MIQDPVERIREIVRDAGFADLRRLVKAWHLYGDWEAHRTYFELDCLLECLGYPGVPHCCQMEDHMRGDGKVFFPGDPGAAPNWEAASA